MPRAAPLRAAIFDLDGVVTRTAAVHARAWELTFDRALSTLAGARAFRPFAIEEYRAYVDGRPRLDGVRSFLAARGIELAEGGPDDPAGALSVHGLGKAKNETFLRLLSEEGVQVYDDAVALLHRCRANALDTAVVTASRNAGAVLRAGDLERLFDVKVDGNDAAHLALAGKPAPDTFVAAARLLARTPGEAFVLEDAVAGVAAGRAGGFALVVGVARDGESAALLRAGAHRVVRDLRELYDVVGGAPEPRGEPREASP